MAVDGQAAARRRWGGVGEGHDDRGRLGSHAATCVEGSSPWRGREAGKRRVRGEAERRDLPTARLGIHGALLQLGDEDTGAVPMAGAEARCSGSAVSGRVAVAASGEGAERRRGDDDTGGTGRGSE